MEVDDRKIEVDDSAYGSFANNSRNSQGSSKSLTSTWSCSSGCDQPDNRLINDRDKSTVCIGNKTSNDFDQDLQSINQVSNAASTDNKHLSIHNEALLIDNSYKSDGGSPFRVASRGCGKTSQKNSEIPSFVVAISMQDLFVTNVRGSIKEILGYTKDKWIGRNLIDFVYQKDRNLFINHISNKEHVMEDDIDYVSNGRSRTNQEQFFYCRFKKYEGEINGNNNYCTLHLSTRLADETDDNNVKVNATVKDVDRHRHCNVTAIVTPVQSAYHVPDEIPSMRPFTTRHSASCHFSHVDDSAICYLGYLPQDIIGNSIFDYYHPEDLPHLQEVYEQVLKEEGRLFRSKPYRFLVRNGLYILLETEWSCFINPWNRKLEFVIGHHRVIKGPKKPDVFVTMIEPEVEMKNLIPDAVLEESKNIQMEIKQLLNETVKSLAGLTLLNRKRRKQLAKYVGNLLEEIVQTLDVDVDTYCKSSKEGESFSEQGSIVMGHISPHHHGTPSENFSAILPSYHRCNYDDNIQRYFDSRPKTYSSASTGDSRHMLGGVSTPPQTDDDDINLSPPVDSGDDGSRPMQGLISEDQGGSNGQDQLPELPVTSVAATVSSPLTLLDVGHLLTKTCPSYVRVALTERILSKHNEVTEKTFVQQVHDTRSATSLLQDRDRDRNRDRDRRMEPVPNGGNRLKRCASHSPDLNNHKVNKHHHADKLSTVDQSRKFTNRTGRKLVKLCPISTPTRTPIPTFTLTPAATYSTASVHSPVVTIPHHSNVMLAADYRSCHSTVITHGQSADIIPQAATHLLVPVEYVKAIDGGLMTEPLRSFQSYSKVVPTTSTIISSLQDRVRLGLHIDSNGQRFVPNCKPVTQNPQHPLMRHPVAAAKLDFTNMMLSSSLFDHQQPQTMQGGQQLQSMVKSQMHLPSTQPPSDTATTTLVEEGNSKERLKIIAHSTTEATSSSSANCNRQFDGLMIDDLTGSSLNSFLKSDLDVSDCGSGSMKTLASSTDETNDFMKRKRSIGKSLSGPTCKSCRNCKPEVPPPMKLKKESCWMEEVNLTRELMNTYRMPCRDIYQVLGDDVDKLRRMPQPDAVNEQLARLYDEVHNRRQRMTQIHHEDHDHRHQRHQHCNIKDCPEATTVVNVVNHPDLICNSSIPEAMFTGQDLDDVALYLLEDMES